MLSCGGAPANCPLRHERPCYSDQTRQSTSLSVRARHPTQPDVVLSVTVLDARRGGSLFVFADGSAIRVDLSRPLQRREDGYCPEQAATR